MIKRNKASKETRNNVARAMEIVMQALETGDDFMLSAAMLYMGREDVDIEKTSFEEWLTDDRMAEVAEAAARLKQFNDTIEEIEKELEAESEEEQDEVDSDDFYREIADNFDLEEESECRELLEIYEEEGAFERCPRCGTDMEFYSYSRKAKVGICVSCRMDEEKKIQHRKSDRLTDWNFIQYLQSEIAKCA